MTREGIIIAGKKARMRKRIFLKKALSVIEPRSFPLSINISNPGIQVNEIKEIPQSAVKASIRPKVTAKRKR